MIMIPRCLVTRAALRQSRIFLRQISTSPQCLAFQSYSLPQTSSGQPRNDNTYETSISSPAPPPSSSKDRPAEPPTTASNPPVKLSESQAQTPTPPPPRPRSKLRAPRKAPMRLTPSAVEHLRRLLDQPDPKLIKVGVRNRGCSGLAYHLEFVDRAGSFDEQVEQDGVKVLIDSKALFSIIGSEMDWVEDKLSQRFVFKNPNIKDQCGCGESFMV